MHRQLELKIKQVNDGWLTFYEEAIADLKLKFKEIDSEAIRAWMDKSERERREIDAEIAAITKEIDQLDREIDRAQPERSDEELARLKQLTEEKLVHFKNLMNKKQTLYSEMLNNARILMDINDQMIVNEEEKLKLLEEIDKNAIELIHAKEQVAQMTEAVEQKKAKYKGLKVEIRQLDEKVHVLTFSLKEKESELEELKHLIAQKDIELEGLIREAGVNPPEFVEMRSPQSKQRNFA